MILQVVDLVLLGAGCLCVIGFVVRLRRRGRWRNPLSGVAIPEQGPSGLSAVMMILAFIAVPMALLDLLTHGLPWEEVLRPGSYAWHRAQTADGIGKSIVCLLMIGLLARTRAFAGPPPRVGLWSGILVGLVGVLVIVPIVTVQLRMGTLVWEWIQPEVEPPQHPVLLALNTSDWGRWGIVQLLLGAVVIAPLAEELLFRGVLLQTLCRHLRLGWAAILFSSVLFGCVHVGQPQAVLPLTSMGIILGYLRLRSGSLGPCILAHILFNARTMTFNLLASELLEPV